VPARSTIFLWQCPAPTNASFHSGCLATMGTSRSGHSWTMATTASAPAAQASWTPRSSAGSSASKVMPSKRLAIAARSVVSVARPTTPILIPRRSTIAEAGSAISVIPAGARRLAARYTIPLLRRFSRNAARPKSNS